MKRFIIECFILAILPSVYGQTSIVSIERANSLSNMADFYYTAGNLDRAVELQKQSMDMIGVLHGKGSFEYASSALTLANYCYSKGHNDSLNSKRLANQSYANAIENLQIALDVINDSLLVDYDEMDSGERYKLWQQVCPLFDRLLPCYVSCYQNDSTVSTLYNSILFSKGITWCDYHKAKKGDWRTIQKTLHSDDLAIEFISPVNLEEDNISFYALVLNSKNKAPKMIKMFDILQLQDSLKCAVSKYDKNLIIGKLIWRNLRKELQGIKNIFFSATHVFHNIPIEFLPIDEKEYYCDKYNMYRLSSTMELVSDNSRPQYKNAVLYGGLEYDSKSDVDSSKKMISQTRAGLESLYNTGIEIYEISQLLQAKGVKCKNYTGLLGSETSFKSLSGQPLDILHLSTHGLFQGDSNSSKYIDEDLALSQSYLAFSGANKRLTDPLINDDNDGVVTALDISIMQFKELDLVCLSACESALGTYSDDDGILGLQRGFKKAGANTILMSIDKVDDEATKILMVEFYKNLMDGKSKYQSLKDAQKHLRQVDNRKFDEPEYWASFIMLDGLN